MELTGTPFQIQCWKVLKECIPAGSVITYKGLASLVGKPKAFRAVGSAMAKNPQAPIIPCHRVVGYGGRLGGFTGGINVKIERLRLEAVQVRDGKIVDFEQHLFPRKNNKKITSLEIDK